MLFYADISFGVGTTRIIMYADNDFDGTTASTQHLGCNVGDSGTIGSAGDCRDNSVASGTFTSFINAEVTSDRTATLSVTYTVVNNTSVNITSAAVTWSEGAQSSLQGAISRSQTVVTTNNIGARFASIKRGASAINMEGQANLSQKGYSRSDHFSNNAQGWVGEKDEALSQSVGIDVRGLAMHASFDTSKMVLAASGAEKTMPNAGSVPLRGQTLDNPWTIWGNGSYTDLKNSADDGTFDGDNRHHGDVWGYNVGIDYRFSPQFYVGISGGYSKTDLITTYNAGTYKEKVLSVSPYALWRPQPNLSISGIVGYSSGDIDLTQTSSTVSEVAAETDSNMWFSEVNIDYAIAPLADQPFELMASAGVLVGRKKTDGYTESNGTVVSKTITNTTQLAPGIEMSYAYEVNGATIQPYAKSDFVYDFADPTNGDKGAFNVGGGLRFNQYEHGLSGSIDMETVVGRTDYREYTINGIVAYSFKLGSSTSQDNASVFEPYISSNFVDAGKTYGTGFKFLHGSSAISSNLDLTYTAPIGADEPQFDAKVSAEMRF